MGQRALLERTFRDLPGRNAVRAETARSPTQSHSWLHAAPAQSTRAKMVQLARAAARRARFRRRARGGGPAAVSGSAAARHGAARGYRPLADRGIPERRGSAVWAQPRRRRRRHARARRRLPRGPDAAVPSGAARHGRLDTRRVADGARWLRLVVDRRGRRARPVERRRRELVNQPSVHTPPGPGPPPGPGAPTRRFVRGPQRSGTARVACAPATVPAQPARRARPRPEQSQRERARPGSTPGSSRAATRSGAPERRRARPSRSGCGSVSAALTTSAAVRSPARRSPPSAASPAGPGGPMTGVRTRPNGASRRSRGRPVPGSRVRLLRPGDSPRVSGPAAAGAGAARGEGGARRLVARPVVAHGRRCWAAAPGAARRCQAGRRHRMVLVIPAPAAPARPVPRRRPRPLGRGRGAGAARARW